MVTMVTGAAGYLGSHIVDVLLERGEDVIGVDNMAWGRGEHIDRLSDEANFTFAELDINETEAVRSLVSERSVDTVLHLAALHFIPAAVADPTLAMRINVLGTQSMLDACSADSVERFTFMSTGDVYAPSDEPHHEDAELGPFNIYGLSKRQGEELVALANRSQDKRFVVARLFNLYGERETNPHIVPEIVDQLRASTPALRLGNLEPRRDMVPVQDAARAIVEATHAVEPGVTTVNIASGTAHRMADVVETLVRLSETNVRVETDPAKVRASERMNLQADVSRLRSLIGWAPDPDLERGMSRLVTDEGLTALA